MPLLPSDDTSRPPRLLVANLLAQTAFGLLAMTISLPSMQEWGETLNGSQTAVQLTFSAFVVSYGILQLIYGPLSDRIGRKRALMIGLVLAFAGSVWAALASDLATLIVARVVQGAGCAAGAVVGRAMVQDLFHGPHRMKVLGYVGMAVGLSPPLATVIGGQLHVMFGWQANFVLMAALALGLGVATWRGVPAHKEAISPEAHWLPAAVSAYGRLCREPSFLLFVVVLSMISASFYAFLAGAPFVLGNYGVGPDGVGFYVMLVPLAFIVGSFLTSRLAHRSSEHGMMLCGQSLIFSGIALMGFLAWAGVGSPMAFAGPLMLMGLGNGLLIPPALSGTVSLMPSLAGAAAAVVGLMQQLTGAAGGVAVGLIPQIDALGLAGLMMSLCLVGVSAQWMLYARSRDKARFAG